MAAVYCVLLLLLALLQLCFHCKAAPHHSIDNPVATALLVLQSPFALESYLKQRLPYQASDDQPEWLIFKLLVGAGVSVHVDPCNTALNDNDVPLNPDNIVDRTTWKKMLKLWPNLFTENSIENERDSFRQQFKENGFCAKQFEPVSGDASYAGTASEYFQQAVNLFSYAVVKSATTSLNSTLDPAYTASVYVKESLNRLFQGNTKPLVKPTVKQVADNGFKRDTASWEVYLGCQKVESKHCIITRVGLCFQCKVNPDSPSSTPTHTCSPNHAANPDTYPQGQFIPCQVPGADSQTPWNKHSENTHVQDVSCYDNEECELVYYFPGDKLQKRSF